MAAIFMTRIQIDKVRHLEGIEIPLSSKERKHLIFTGKNGSGKTSVLEAMQTYMSFYQETYVSDQLDRRDQYIKYWKDELKRLQIHENSEKYKIERIKAEKSLIDAEHQYERYYAGLKIEFTSEADLFDAYHSNDFIMAYYEAERFYKPQISDHVQKIELQDKYSIDDKPSIQFVNYLVDLKVRQALAMANKEPELAEEIGQWFERFEELLRVIFSDQNLRLCFDVNTYKFTILEENREPFGFDELSSGYAAIVDIIVDLMMRVEKRRFYEMQGIVLIDEIETHLHIELQKNILPILTKIFPNIQFVCTTHSPFILNSIANAVIFDLENKTLVEDGLEELSYEGVVEGYFKADTLSNKLRRQFENYKELAQKKDLSMEDLDKITNMEYYLDEIPDYLSLDFAAEYAKIKLMLHNREVEEND